jgi:hypothetical protein
MFRGVHYVTLDYMMYVQDGWITFAYWKPQYVYEKVKIPLTKPNESPPIKSENINLINMSSAGQSAADTSADASAKPSSSKKEKKPATTKLQISKRTARLNICLCNFQLHYYNSWKLNAMNKQMSEESKTATKSGFLQSNSIMNFISSNFNLASLNLNGNNNSPGNGGDPGVNSKDDGQQEVTSVNATATVNSNSSDYNFTEDLMQLFSVVNIKIQKVSVYIIVLILILINN